MFSISKKSLFFHQLISHMFFIYMIFYGSLDEWIIAVGIFFVFMTLGGTITLHRLLSHRSFKCSKFWEYLGSFIATISGVGSTLSWAAIHREHHRYTDQLKDPHSPKFKNIFKIQFLSMFDIPNLKYVPDLLRSPFHLFLHNYYWLINLLYIVFLFLIDPFYPIYFYFVPSMLIWNAGSSINTINHLFGYRNYATNDQSTNNLLTGYLVSGEGWHNNHHSEPWNSKFGKKWWEFDLGYIIINLISYKDESK
jgi:fatty-acid desaturase